MIPTRDDGARQHNVSELYIDEATVTKRIVYTVPWKAIFYDIDGTLTGLGPKTWATHNYSHLEAMPECTLNYEVYDGVICDSTVRLRRVSFEAPIPSDPFFMQSMFVVPMDDAIIGDMTEEELQVYLDDNSNYGEIEFTMPGDPGMNTVPVLVTGHKFKVHWSVGIDFEDIDIVPS